MIRGNPFAVAVVLLACGVGARAETIHDAIFLGKEEQVLELLRRSPGSARSRSESGDTPLHAAARAGREPLVKALLRAGADINASGEHQDTPLHCAAGAGQTAMCELLLQSGANLNARNKHNVTPMVSALHASHSRETWRKPYVETAKMLLNRGAQVDIFAACAFGQKATVAALLDGGQWVNRQDDLEKTPLMWAVQFGHEELVAYLLERSADVRGRAGASSWNYQASALRGILHWAVMSGNQRIMDLLLAKGADINVQDMEDATPLHYAVDRGDAALVQYLMSKGADTNAKTNTGKTPLMAAVYEKNAALVALLQPHTKTDTGTGKGASGGALHAAVGAGDTAAVQALLAGGANASAQDVHGRTPLHWAARQDQPDMARLLIANKSDASVRDVLGGTALHTAARMNRADLVAMLLESGAPVDAVDAGGWAALHWAVWRGHGYVTRQLLNAGARRDAATLDGFTPLHLALRNPSQGMASLLLERGAQPDATAAVGLGQPELLAQFLKTDPTLPTAKDARAWEGKTLLHWAAYYNKPACAELLTAAGALAQTADRNGMTPLHDAALAGRAAMVEWLLARGAAVNAEDRFFATPLDLAEAEGHAEALALLRAAGGRSGRPGARWFQSVRFDASLIGRLRARYVPDQAPKVSPEAAQAQSMMDAADDMDAERWFSPVFPRRAASRAYRERTAPQAVGLLHIASAFDDLDERLCVRRRFRHHAMLDLFGVAASGQQIERGLGSADPSVKLEAQLARATQAWWLSRNDPDTQGAILDALDNLARHGDTDDDCGLLAAQLLSLARAGASTPALMRRAATMVRTALRNEKLAQAELPTILSEARRWEAESQVVDLAGSLPDGSPFATSRWRGKVILVDFWATHCGPCIVELPRLKQLYQRHHAHGLEILGISCDRSQPKLMQFLAKHPDMPWPHLFDANSPGLHPIAEAYGVDSIPALFVIDKKGVLRSTDARRNLEEWVARLLAE